MAIEIHELLEEGKEIAASTIKNFYQWKTNPRKKTIEAIQQWVEKEKKKEMENEVEEDNKNKDTNIKLIIIIAVVIMKVKFLSECPKNW